MISHSLQHSSVSWARYQPVCNVGCLRGFAPLSVPQAAWHSPVLSSLLRITLTLACPMDLKNFPMDVQTCIMQLESCESCTSPSQRGDNVFPLSLSFAISLPNCNSFPVQPSLGSPSLEESRGWTAGTDLLCCMCLGHLSPSLVSPAPPCWHILCNPHAIICIYIFGQLQQ